MFETSKTWKRPEGRARDPEATRERLLHCAFQEIYEHGYAGSSLDQILAEAGVTKGALYHHFGSKAELGYAVIDEVIRPFLVNRWLAPLAETDDPVTALGATLEAIAAEITPRELACGCPLNNLSQELANSEDEEFRRRLDRVFDGWRDGIAEALCRGIEAGTVRAEVDPPAVAAFIVASFEGMATTAKSSRDRALAGAVVSVLIDVLESLRPTRPALDPSVEDLEVEIAEPPAA